MEVGEILIRLLEDESPPGQVFNYFCRMRKNAAIFLITALVAGFATSAQDKWDLRRAVEYALVNNISIQQQDIQAQVAQLTFKQSDLSKYPNLNMFTNGELNTGRSVDPTTNLYTTQSIFSNTFSLQSNVDLFNWFSKRNTITGNRLEAEAARASVDKLKDDIALNVATAFLQALLAKEQVNVSRVQIGQTIAQVENTRKQVEAGSLPELNLLQLEAQLANDSAVYISAVGTETQSLLLLKSILNLDAATPFDIVTPTVEFIPIEPIAELQPEKVYQLAIANRPQQRANQLRLEAARKFQEAARGQMYPTLSAGAGLFTRFSTAKNNPQLVSSSIVGFDTIGVVSGSTTPVVSPKFQNEFSFYASPYTSQFVDNINYGVGLSLNIPIFNGYSARTNLEKSKLNVKSLALQQSLDNMTLKQDIYTAYTDAMTALQRFNAATKAVDASQKAYDFAQKRYGVGLLSTIDLIISQNNLFRAKIDRLSAQFDYLFKMKVLEFYKGQGIKL